MIQLNGAKVIDGTNGRIFYMATKGCHIGQDANEERTKKPGSSGTNCTAG